MPTDSGPPDLVYLGRVRLHRLRVNAIQSMQTVAALESVGIRVVVFVPPSRGGNRGRNHWLAQLGINREIDVRASWLLRPRHGFWPFVFTHGGYLRRAKSIYTRVPEISLALGRRGLRHHLEVHEAHELVRRGLLRQLIELQRDDKLDWFVPITRSDASVLKDAGADPARIHVAPSGVDTDAFSRVQRFDPTTLSCPRVLYMGSLRKCMGHKVFEALVRSGQCRVAVVGEPAATSGRDTDAANSGSSFESFPAIPHCQVPEWYSRSDVAVLPYHRTLRHANSISPLKLFESMAAGRPILVSDLPPIREVIQHERTGLLVDPDDPQAWVDALGRIRDDPELAVRLADAARQEAMRYSWKVRAKGIARVVLRKDSW